MAEMSGRKQRDREQTKERLVEAVVDIIRERGFEEIGVNAVAERAGVSKVLIYRYFGDLDGLFQAVAERLDPLQSKAADRLFEQLGVPGEGTAPGEGAGGEGAEAPGPGDSAAPGESVAGTGADARPGKYAPGRNPGAAGGGGPGAAGGHPATGTGGRAASTEGPATGTDTRRAVRESIRRTILDLHMSLKNDDLTKHLLVWELSNRNSITEAMSVARERTGLELTERYRRWLSERGDPGDLDLNALFALITAGVFYLTLRSDAVSDFNGLDIGSDAGWERIASLVADLVDARIH